MYVYFEYFYLYLIFLSDIYIYIGCKYSYTLFPVILASNFYKS